MHTVPAYLAINYANNDVGVQDGDMSSLRRIGITKVRISLPSYQDADYIAQSRATALKAKSYGFYVIYGISSNTYENGDWMISNNNWPDYVAAATAEATWAETNGIDEFQIGNEEELHNFKVLSAGQLTRTDDVATCVTTTHHNMINGDTVTVLYADQAAYNGDHVITRIDDHTFTYVVAGAPATPATGAIQIYGITNADLRTNLLALEATIRGVFSGVVSCAFNADRMYDWIDNIGGLDFVTTNVYGRDADPTVNYPNFKYVITKAIRNFGSKFYLSEFNISYLSTEYGTEEFYAGDLANRIAFLTKSGIQLAYFFHYGRGDFSVLDNSNVIRAAYYSLFGRRKGTA